MKYFCDTCKDETEHELMRTDKHLYQCRECGTVSYHLPEKEVHLRAVLSSGEQSEVGSITLKESDVIEVKDELIVDTENGFKLGEVTSLELKSGRRSEMGEVRDISTVWLRDVGEVAVRISLHKKAVTTPYIFKAPGETEFTINEKIEINNASYKITRIKLNNGRLLKNDGEKAKAKEIKRVYALFERRRKK